MGDGDAGDLGGGVKIIRFDGVAVADLEGPVSNGRAGGGLDCAGKNTARTGQGQAHGLSDGVRGRIDPEFVGAWLQAVVRRACMQHERRRRSGELLTDSLPDLLDERSGPEDRIERLELRDWIWGALQRLPEPLRVSAMLRYFGSYDSYDEVAAILGVPIGTVRSRLSEAKVKLADALLASAGLIDDEARVRARARERFWNDEFQNVFRRGESDRFVSHFTTDLLIGWSGGKMARGREHLVAEIEGDLAVGVRIDLERVMTNDGIAVVEGRFVNPPEAPDHCPPGVALVMFGDDDRTSAMRLHLAPRAPRPDED